MCSTLVDKEINNFFRVTDIGATFRNINAFRVQRSLPSIILFFATNFIGISDISN